MSDYFKDIPTIKYEGRDSTNPLSFKFYDANKKILGKTLEEHLRMAVCYWHTFNWPGGDPFGGQTFLRPWMEAGDKIEQAKDKLNNAFDFFEKLGIPLAERAKLAGVAVDAVFDSVSVATTFKDDLAKKGMRNDSLIVGLFIFFHVGSRLLAASFEIARNLNFIEL